MTSALDGPWDVVIVGGGNAAVVSALSARHHVDRVLLLERAPIDLRGGNTRHTRNLRCVHRDADRYNSGGYLYQELWDDLCNVGTGPSNEELAALTVEESEAIPQWMTDHGVLWQPPLRGTLHLDRTNRFFLGGGKALINTYYKAMADMGVSVVYDACVEKLVMDGPRCSGLDVRVSGQPHRVRADAVICASGGFEANIEWLRRYWGDAADNYIIRGAKYNDGMILQELYDHGAAPAGEEKGFHAVAVDARAPRFDGGIATRLDMIPFAIVINKFGERFYDEGEEIWPKRYAIWGRKIAEQSDQIAFSIWDSKAEGLFLPPMYGATRADTIAELARSLGLDDEVLIKTIGRYNEAVWPSGEFDSSRLDGCRTEGLSPPKSNWARPIDTPPYYGIAMRPGVTFTYMGVAVDPDARVRLKDGSSFANVFAAGEIMSGNILSSGYLAGFGLTIGSVWGRLAGTGAARVVRQ